MERECSSRTHDWKNIYGPVRLSYEPYYFSERTMFFTYNKSANNTFSHDFSAKRTGPQNRRKDVFGMQKFISQEPEKILLFNRLISIHFNPFTHDVLFITSIIQHLFLFIYFLVHCTLISSLLSSSHLRLLPLPLSASFIRLFLSPRLKAKSMESDMMLSKLKTPEGCSCAL